MGKFFMQVGEEYKALSRGALVNTLGQLCRLTRALSLVLFARVLGSHDFGLYFLVWGLTEIVQHLGLMGFHNGALWLASERAAQNRIQEIRQLIFPIFWVGTFLGLLTLLVIYFVGPTLVQIILKKPAVAEPWLIFSLTIPFFIGSRILVYSLRATLKMHYEVLVCFVLEPATILIVGTTLLLLGWGLLGCVVAHVIAQIAGWLLALFFFLRIFPLQTRVPTKVPWRSFLTYSVYLAGVDILQMTKQRLDLMMVGRFLTFELVGVYGALSETGLVIRKIRYLFDPILLPLISQLRALKDQTRLQQEFIVTIRWVLIVGLGFYGILWIAPAPILKIFGAGFVVGTTALLIFAAGEMVHATLGLMEGDLQMAGKSNLIFLNGLLTLIINLLLLLWLVPKFGISGAAIATAATLTLIGVLRVLQVKRLEGFLPFHPSQMKPILACLVGLGLCYLLKLPGDFLTIGIYLTLFLALLKLLRLESEDQAAWERLKARFKN